MKLRMRLARVLVGAMALGGAASQLTACGACGDSGKRSEVRPTVSGNFGGTAQTEQKTSLGHIKTSGGVVLEGVPDDVLQAAKDLVRTRDAGVQALLAAGPRAKETVIKLLGSKNLNELRGAIACVVAPGDPIGLKAEAFESLLPLTTHDASDVREAARAAVEGLADAKRLIETLTSPVATARLGAVRLLAGWDGLEVQSALVERFADPDLAFAREAMLAATAAGKAPSDEVKAALAKLVASGGERAPIGMRGLVRLGVTVEAEGLKAAFASADGVLVAEAVRAAGANLSPEQRATLSTDTRAEVRRALADVSTAPADLAVLSHDEDLTVRLTAIGALGRAGAEIDRLATLTPFLKDPEPAVQRAAIAAMATGARPEAATRNVLEWSDKGDGNVKLFAVAALGRIPDRSAIDALIARLPDDGLGPYAQSVLRTVTGEDHGVDTKAWGVWRDAKYPVVEPK